MTDLLAALQRSIDQARELVPAPEAESIDDVFADTGDTYQRFNATWHQNARESKEGSP